MVYLTKNDFQVILWYSFFQFVYTVNSGADLYINSQLKASSHQPQNIETSTLRSGHIVLGVTHSNNVNVGQNYGKITIDYLTIWEKPLSQNEISML